MSIDDYAGGAGRGAASLLHRNCDADFPEWAGQELAATGLLAQILAQDGATAADVLQQQLPLIEQPPAVVTLTMGGNDLLAIYGNSAAAETTIGEVIAIGEEVLSGLNAASGGARIVVTTVYDPSDAPSQALSRPASRNLWYCNLIEPNAWGAHEIRRTWWQALHASR